MSVFDSVNSGLSDVTTFAQGVTVSLNQLVGTSGELANSVLKVKSTIDAITGKSENKTTQQIATQNEKSLLNSSVVSPEVQNILIVVGIVAAGIGVIYAIRK